MPLARETLKMLMRCVFVLLAVAAFGSDALGQQYYQSSGGTVSFSKSPFADPNLPANQDAITANVAITRGSVQGIYNAVSEPGYQGTSPAGTLWYFGGTVQDVIDGTIGPPDFELWIFAHGSNPLSTLGVNGVLYLEAEDAYVDIRFTQWSAGSGGGGGFAYTRAIVPEPPSCAGDVTGAGGIPDGMVDVDDLNAILSVWGTTVGMGSPLDLANNDGVIDVDDLNVVLSNWACS